MRSLTGNCTWVALTATATSSVVEDILRQLRLRQVKSFRVPCFRSNLFYDVRFRDAIADEFEDLKDYVVGCLGDGWEEGRDRKSGCGIVYCRTRDGTEVLAAQLRRRGVPCLAYHAGLKGTERARVQEEWMSGVVAVITATISFGMGVDKASVRFVVHWCAPQSVAGYYQESGRAGRDGKQSYCRIYYSRQERDTMQFLLKQELARAKTESKREQVKASVKSFHAMVSYCEGVSCRHAAFSAFFGDSPPECIHRCDVCKERKKVEKRVLDFNGTMVRNMTYRSEPLSVNGYDGSLYEGGRKGAKMGFANYGKLGFKL